MPEELTGVTDSPEIGTPNATTDIDGAKSEPAKKDSSDEFAVLDGQYKGKDAIEKAIRESKQKITQLSEQLKDRDAQLKEVQTSRKLNEVDEKVATIERGLQESQLAQRENESRKQWVERVGEDNVEFFETYSRGLRERIEGDLKNMKETFQQQFADMSKQFTGELERRDPAYVSNKAEIDAVAEKYGVPLAKAKVIYADMARLKPEPRETPPANGNDGIRAPEPPKKADRMVALAETIRKAGGTATAEQLREVDEATKGVFV